ncbi:MAG: hypothetical protein O2931_00605 [Planctomycetota bacterium]|nr:hypothetical protein [Planctomycetota bacterium]MDA1177274.1 hypothetical protein [Planctomycetota bacterium]
MTPLHESETIPLTPVRRLSIPFSILQVVISGILGIAALLKAHILLTQPTLSPTWFDSRVFRSSLVSAEFLLVAWFFATPRFRIARGLAIVLFGSFLAVSLWKLASGATSCGCFGTVQVHPIWTVLLDAFCLTLLVLSRPDSGLVKYSPRFAEALVISAALVLVVIPFSVMAFRPVGASLGAGKLVVTPGELVILEPETWLNQRCPILDHIETAEDVVHGEAVLVLVRHDCPTCAEKIAEYQRMTSMGLKRFVLVEVPPFGNNLKHVASGRLRGDVDWFVQTPAEIFLEDGIVKRASHESLALKNLTSDQEFAINRVDKQCNTFRWRRITHVGW